VKTTIAFDLDGTLAESKQPIAGEMAGLLAALLEVAGVAIISGGDWPQFDKQVASRLPARTRLERLLIMPTTGTKLYRHEGTDWHLVYADGFSPEERARIVSAIDGAVAGAGLHEPRLWGERIEDRGSQITFSGLGQQAPLEAKKVWDPDFAKRRRLQALLQKRLPDLAINIGGSTSVDITRSGVDKAYGLRRLCEATGIRTSEILFLGDAMYPGGNDYPVSAAGIDAIAVRDVTETATAIRAVIACLKP
jgi:HAD superfamily hydrolase (TIGR01484 family)